eukprot:352861-Chlamydomonas_euryale.AAC.8
MPVVSGPDLARLPRRPALCLRCGTSRGSVDMKRKSIDSPTTDAASPARRTSLDHSAAASPAARRKSVDAGRKSLDAGHATGSPRGSLDIGGELNMSAPPACDSACLL